MEILPARHVLTLDRSAVDDPVAIQKHCPLHRDSVRSGPYPPLRPSTNTPIVDIAHNGRYSPVCYFNGCRSLPSGIRKRFLFLACLATVRYFRSRVDDGTGGLIRKRDSASPRFWMNASD